MCLDVLSSFYLDWVLFSLVSVQFQLLKGSRILSEYKLKANRTQAKCLPFLYWSRERSWVLFILLSPFGRSLLAFISSLSSLTFSFFRSTVVLELLVLVAATSFWLSLTLGLGLFFVSHWCQFLSILFFFLYIFLFLVPGHAKHFVLLLAEAHLVCHPTCLTFESTTSWHRHNFFSLLVRWTS